MKKTVSQHTYSITATLVHGAAALTKWTVKPNWLFTRNELSGSLLGLRRLLSLFSPFLWANDKKEKGEKPYSPLFQVDSKSFMGFFIPCTLSF